MNEQRWEKRYKIFSSNRVMVCVWVKLQFVRQNKAVKFQHYLSKEYNIASYLKYPPQYLNQVYGIHGGKPNTHITQHDSARWKEYYICKQSLQSLLLGY